MKFSCQSLQYFYNELKSVTCCLFFICFVYEKAEPPSITTSENGTPQEITLKTSIPHCAPIGSKPSCDFAVEIKGRDNFTNGEHSVILNKLCIILDTVEYYSYLLHVLSSSFLKLLKSDEKRLNCWNLWKLIVPMLRNKNHHTYNFSFRSGKIWIFVIIDIRD